MVESASTTPASVEFRICAAARVRVRVRLRVWIENCVQDTPGRSPGVLEEADQ